jgi:hypothetical protein
MADLGLFSSNFLLDCIPILQTSFGPIFYDLVQILGRLKTYLGPVLVPLLELILRGATGPVVESHRGKQG